MELGVIGDVSWSCVRRKKLPFAQAVSEPAAVPRRILEIKDEQRVCSNFHKKVLMSTFEQ